MVIETLKASLISLLLATPPFETHPGLQARVDETQCRVFKSNHTAGIDFPSFSTFALPAPAPVTRCYFSVCIDERANDLILKVGQLSQSITGPMIEDAQLNLNQVDGVTASADGVTLRKRSQFTASDLETILQLKFNFTQGFSFQLQLDNDRTLKDKTLLESFPKILQEFHLEDNPDVQRNIHLPHMLENLTASQFEWVGDLSLEKLNEFYQQEIRNEFPR